MHPFKRRRFLPDIISYAVWLHYRFHLRHPDIEDLLAERGITVIRQSGRLWCIKLQIPAVWGINFQVPQNNRVNQINRPPQSNRRALPKEN